MPRPRPLSNVSTAPYDADQQLTPRTPHSGSRTSRLEQGFSKVNLTDRDDGDLDDLNNLQSAPLLASSSTARFSVRDGRSRQTTGADASSKDGRRRKTFLHPTQIFTVIANQLPLAFGAFMAGVLLILVVISYYRPEALHRYIGVKPPVTTNATTEATATSKNLSESVVPPKPVLIQPPAGVHLISYENYTSFPLRGQEYSDECYKLNSGYMAHGDFWDVSHMSAYDVLHLDDESICSSTVTYMLDGTVGLTADLALMAQVAALAAERNRTFLVEDTHWDRGRWLDHFEDVRTLQPGPQPGCKAPPAEELVACPRTSRHWLISARTAKFHLGGPFHNHYDNAYGHGVNRLRPIFDFAVQSLTTTIRPNAENFGLIQKTRKELSTFLQVVNKGRNVDNIIYTGTHIRRGDRKTLSYTFADRKVPIADYLHGVTATWSHLHSGALASMTPVVYLATDSPDARHQFARQYQELYQGETFSLFNTTDPKLRVLASPAEYDQTTFDAQFDLQSRIRATRGMIVDLALVSGLWLTGNDITPESTVCAMSSSVCRLSAVGLGWERCFGKVDEMGYIDEKTRHWVEVDEKGQVEPVWQAFQLF